MEASEKPLRCHLKEGVVPSIFHNTQAYLSTAITTPRTTAKATPSSRREQAILEMLLLEETYDANDDVSELIVKEILAWLQIETTVPSDFTFTLIGQTLFIYFLDVEFDIVKVVACVALKTDLMIVVSLDGKEVSALQCTDLVKGNLKQMSQLVNLIARVKS